MAEAKDPSKSPQGEGAGTRVGAPSGPSKTPVTFRNTWPIPVLVLATGMLVGGSALFVISRRQRPDPVAPFNHAIELVDAQKYEEGLDALNGKDVLRLVDFGPMTGEQRARYHLSLARALFGTQAAKGLNVRENFRTIVGEYTEARKLGAALDQADSVRLAESLLAIGEVEKALDVARALPDADGGAARRTRLIKSIIEHNLRDDGGRRETLTLELLASLVSDPELTNPDKAWVLARQAELLLEMGRPDEAINKLIRRIGLLREVSSDQQGELYVLVGRAYFESDQSLLAARQLEIADTLLDKSSQVRADMNVMLGRIAQGAREFDKARDRYAAVIAEFPNARALQRARLGIAETEAALALEDRERTDANAMERYAELVEQVRDAAADKHKAKHAQAGIRREDVFESLMRRFQERYNAGQDVSHKESALRFAMLAETLYSDNEVPAELLAAIGRTHRALADEAMAQARAGKPQDFTVEDLDPTTRAEVKQRYMQAGDYLRRYAQAVAASDPASYADALWTAADSFDLAGDLDEARKVFAQYADGASDNDPRKPAAKYRLAQVFQARREFAAAIALYEQLAASRGAPGTNTEAGVWADQAIVPLAQCLVEDGNPANDADAERALIGVVDGSSTMSPDAAAYREALIQLGTMMYKARRYPEAIGWLEQAMKRYPEDRREQGVRYRLADSHRLQAQRIGRDLEKKLSQSQTQELTQARIDHLRAAQNLYQKVREDLETRETHTLSGLEKVYIRNGYFYAGDCAFDLKDYDAAIAAYDAARLRYTDDPASLVAMAQIVSAYAAQGKWAQARTANERARQQLQRFPDDVWSRSDLPMEKRHWEQWLAARTLLEQAAQAEDGGDK